MGGLEDVELGFVFKTQVLTPKCKQEMMFKDVFSLHFKMIQSKHNYKNLRRDNNMNICYWLVKAQRKPQQM